MCDKLAQAIIPGPGTCRDDVGERLAAQGDPNLLATAHGSQSLTQRLFELLDTDLAHVDTLAAKGPLSVIFGAPPPRGLGGGAPHITGERAPIDESFGPLFCA